MICKDRYFLGETPTITLSLKNIGRTLMTVKEFEQQKFSLEVTGLFSNDTVVEKKKINADGSFYVPPAREENGVLFWYGPVVKPPKYVTLRPGESTNLTLDLTTSFNSLLGVGRYKLVFKSENGHKAVGEFEVYWDDEKTVPLMVKRLESEYDSERNWGIANLSEFNRPVFMTSLQALATTGNEKQRQFASFMLEDIKQGNFNPLELRIVTQKRYPRITNPTITVSIANRTRSPETVKEAQQQKFFLEVRKLVLPGEYIEDTKRCVYTPKSEEQARSVTIGASESTSFSLNLQDCFGSRLEPGHYQLIVKSDREEQVKEQTQEQRFEIRSR